MSNATDRHECQICAGSFKTTKDGKMVNHGYKRPGWGYIVGGCYGVGHAPFPATTAIDGAIASAEEAIIEYTEKADNNTAAYVIYSVEYRTRGKVERRRWVYSAEEYYNAKAERSPRSYRYRAEWAEVSNYDKGKFEAGFARVVQKQTEAFRSIVRQAEADIVFWTARKEEGEKQQQQAAEPKTEILRLPEGETRSRGAPHAVRGRPDDEHQDGRLHMDGRRRDAPRQARAGRTRRACRTAR
jgi:hypothetical protein